MTRQLAFTMVSLLGALFPGSLKAQLTHSRYNPALATIFNCCNTDTLNINVVLFNDLTLPAPSPGAYTVYFNGTAFATAEVNADGTFANPDAGSSYQQTISITDLAGMDGQYQPYNGTFSYNVGVNSAAPTMVTVTNYFVYDFLYSFLGLPVTNQPHTPVAYNKYIRVAVNGIMPRNPDHQCPRTGCGCCQTSAGTPMTNYSFNSMMAGVNLSDTPVSYRPPHGEPIRFTVTYNQQDTNQPAVFAQSNLGPQWTFNWMTYISGGPITGQTEAVRYLPGGGQERFEDFSMESMNIYGGYNGSSIGSVPQQTTRAILSAESAGSVRPNFYHLYYPDGSIETYNNNAGGGTNLYLTSRVDPHGNTTTINYAPNSAIITSITDALGQVTTFTYGLASDPLKITQVTDPFGRSATFTYDAQGRLTSITDPIGIVSSFGYQGSTSVVNSLTTPYGTTTFVSQSGPGYQTVQATDPLGQTERLEYQASLASLPASESSVPSVAGLVINNQNLNLYNSFYWDKQAYATAIASGATPGSAAFYNYARVTHWALEPLGVSGTASSMKAPLESRVWYNYQGQASPDFVDPDFTALPSMTARLLDDGSTQLYQKTYDANGDVTQSIDPAGRETDYVYAGTPVFGLDLIEVTQKNGGNNEELFAATYNTTHLPLTTTDAAGQTTTNSYNGFGQPLTITDPLGETTTMAYDVNGYLQTVTGAIPGSTTTYTYDSAGRVATVTDSEGYSVANSYDNIDRLTKQTFLDATFRQTVYDRLSIGSTTDRLGRTTNYTNDALGRVIQIKDPLNRIVTQTWCACGSIKTLKDGNGNTTTWNYDVQGREISKTYADAKGDILAYENSTSRLKAKTDALGQVISYGYAKDNNLLSSTHTNARNATPNVSFTYDPAYNRRISMTDGTGTTNYSYYPVNGQLGAGKLETVNGPIPNSAITYSYDALGRIAGRSINGAANQMSLVYDALGRMTSETNGLGSFTTAYVDQTFRPSSLTYPNGQSTVYSYFNNLGDQRLQEIKNLSGASVLSQFDYTYDAEGEILSWARQTSAANSYALGYDLAGQLLTANLTGASPQTYAYAYDLAANRTNEAIGGSAAPATVNNLNELVSRTGSNARSYAYDSDGELISNSGPTRSSTNYTFSWDAENRLIAINYPTTNQQTQFTYDGLGRKVKITEFTAGAVTSTKQFVWDGLSLAEERDGSGNLTERFYTQGQVNGSTALFYTRDHLGSVREVLTASDVLQARYDYDPYGRRTLISGTDLAEFGFTGHYYHAPSKLHLAPYRPYDADTARWLGRDPKKEAAGSNLYSYVVNTPMVYPDPLGLDIWVETTAAAFGYHQRVCVDLRDDKCCKKGKYCISFGEIDDKGWTPILPTQRQDGKVYADNTDPSTHEDMRYLLPCDGDRCALSRLQGFVGKTLKNSYNYLQCTGENCRNFAQDALSGIANACGAFQYQGSK
jgi:RHS repeat-associated protein